MNSKQFWHLGQTRKMPEDEGLATTHSYNNSLYQKVMGDTKLIEIRCSNLDFFVALESLQLVNSHENSSEKLKCLCTFGQNLLLHHFTLYSSHVLHCSSGKARDFLRFIKTKKWSSLGNEKN